MKDYKKKIKRTAKISEAVKASAKISKSNIPDNSFVVLFNPHDVYVYLKTGNSMKFLSKKDKATYNIDVMKEETARMLEEGTLAENFHVFVGAIKRVLDEKLNPFNPLKNIPDTLQDLTSYFQKYEKEEDW